MRRQAGRGQYQLLASRSYFVETTTVMRTKIAGFLGLAVTFAFSGMHSQGAEGKRPNILLIVADDLGYGELSCQGNRQIPTPNIDSIAKNGIRFTSGYVSGPYCSPTCAGLLTGRYQQRFAHEFNPGPAGTEEKNFGLRRQETTLAERLKAAGYATGMFGKWHLGYRPELQPTRRGFDEFFSFLGGAHSCDNTQVPHDALFWRFGTQRAVRKGDWKLTDLGQGPKLFNLAGDIGEKDDLAAQYPDKL